MIRPPNEGIEVWLCVEPVDFRKQMTGLAALVQDTLAMDPFSTQLFVPFCLGRRNWLFADTVPGANASARLDSLIETAKANALEPYASLRHVFTELPKAQSLAEVEALLPTRLDPASLTRHSLQGPLINPRQ